VTGGLFYLCGVHGAGKTTVLRHLVARYGCVAAERVPVEVAAEAPLDRAMLRTVKYYLEFQHHRDVLSRDGPRILIGDRCIHDTLAYVTAYERLGWISADEVVRVRGLAKFLFGPTDWPDRVIFLAPTVDQARSHLEARWKTEAPGWREDDRQYLETAVASFEHYFATLGRQNAALIETIHVGPPDDVARVAADFIARVVTTPGPADSRTRRSRGDPLGAA
jgi:thymidylate kinase